ncbi:MAG: peptidoglycan DD-metalloendopeptidase family protein [Geitlerinemataceae cyanobacterium]
MKRAFPNQVNSAPACETDANATTGLSKSAQGEGNRRVHLSAATIGLAISMGASGLLLPGQGDAAMAAKPDASRDRAALSPSVSDGGGVPQVEAVESKAKLALEAQQPKQSSWQSHSKEPALVGSTVESDRQATAPDEQTEQFSSPETAFGKQKVEKVATEDFSATPFPSLSVKRATSKKIAPNSQQRFNDSVQLSEELPHSEFADPSASSPTQPTRMQSKRTVSPSTLHQVAPGETIYSIARQYGVSENELEAINQLSDPTLLKAGESIALPSNIKRITPAVLSVFGTEIASTPKTVKANEPKVALLEATLDASVSADPMSTESTESQLTLGKAKSDSQASKVVQTSPTLQISLAASEETEETTQRLANKLKRQPESSNNAYVEELRSEVSQLRSKYRAERETSTANAAALPTNPNSDSTNLSDETELAELARQINPEFNPQQHTAALQSAGLKPWAEPHASMDPELQSEPQAEIPTDETAVAVTSSTEAQDKVSAAPLGASNYAPIRPPQLVSPELPALSSPQAYLPKPSGYQQEITGFIWPSRGILTSGYGWRWGRMHKGIDIAADVGTPVVAVAPGVVTYASWNDGGYGNLVEITHADGSVTVYAHNDRILVREGQRVEQGEQVSEMGSTGFSTGPHLHFELHPGGQGAVDPMAFLPQE